MCVTSALGFSRCGAMQSILNQFHRRYSPPLCLLSQRGLTWPPILRWLASSRRGRSVTGTPSSYSSSLFSPVRLSLPTMCLRHLYSTIPDVAVIFPVRLPTPLFATQAMYDISAKAKLIPWKPGPARRRHIRLDYITVPLIGVLVLLATRAIDSVVLRKGILGADGVEPINIMALFISLVNYHVNFQTAHYVDSYLGVLGHLTRFYRIAPIRCLLGGS